MQASDRWPMQRYPPGDHSPATSEDSIGPAYSQTPAHYPAAVPDYLPSPYSHSSYGAVASNHAGAIHDPAFTPSTPHNRGHLLSPPRSDPSSSRRLPRVPLGGSASLSRASRRPGDHPGLLSSSVGADFGAAWRTPRLEVTMEGDSAAGEEAQEAADTPVRRSSISKGKQRVSVPETPFLATQYSLVPDWEDIQDEGVPEYVDDREPDAREGLGKEIAAAAAGRERRASRRWSAGASLVGSSVVGTDDELRDLVARRDRARAQVEQLLRQDEKRREAEPVVPATSPSTSPPAAAASRSHTYALSPKASRSELQVPVSESNASGESSSQSSSHDAAQYPLDLKAASANPSSASRLDRDGRSSESEMFPLDRKGAPPSQGRPPTLPRIQPVNAIPSSSRFLASPTDSLFGGTMEDVPSYRPREPERQNTDSSADESVNHLFSASDLSPTDERSRMPWSSSLPPPPAAPAYSAPYGRAVGGRPSMPALGALPGDQGKSLLSHSTTSGPRPRYSSNASEVSVARSAATVGSVASRANAAAAFYPVGVVSLSSAPPPAFDSNWRTSSVSANAAALRRGGRPTIQLTTSLHSVREHMEPPPGPARSASYGGEATLPAPASFPPSYSGPRGAASVVSDSSGASTIRPTATVDAELERALGASNLLDMLQSTGQLPQTAKVTAPAPPPARPPPQQQHSSDGSTSPGPSSRFFGFTNRSVSAATNAASRGVPLAVPITLPPPPEPPVYASKSRQGLDNVQTDGRVFAQGGYASYGSSLSVQSSSYGLPPPPALPRVASPPSTTDYERSASAASNGLKVPATPKKSLGKLFKKNRKGTKSGEESFD